MSTEPQLPDDKPRVFGFAPGDRVTIHADQPYEYGSGATGGKPTEPLSWGHVVDAKPGCNLLCRYVCRLILVSIEGSFVGPSTREIFPYDAVLRVDQVRHAD